MAVVKELSKYKIDLEYRRSDGTKVAMSQQVNILWKEE
jgi:hypothetical protein